MFMKNLFTSPVLLVLSQNKQIFLSTSTHISVVCFGKHFILTHSILLLTFLIIHSYVTSKCDNTHSSSSKKDMVDCIKCESVVKSSNLSFYNQNLSTPESFKIEMQSDPVIFVSWQFLSFFASLVSSTDIPFLLCKFSFFYWDFPLSQHSFCFRVYILVHVY